MKLASYFLIAVLSAGCASGTDTEMTSEAVSPELVRNEERCQVEQPILLSCEYESWGKNKAILRVEGKIANYSDISNKETASKLELDGLFPSADYAIGHIKKDLIYRRLEKSGYCAYSGSTTTKTTATKSAVKHAKQKSLTLFLPASILTGLLEDGTLFVRWWKPKKSGSTKHKADEEITPLAERSYSSYEEQVAKCLVQSRGDEKAEPSPSESTDEQAEPAKSDDIKPEY